MHLRSFLTSFWPRLSTSAFHLLSILLQSPFILFPTSFDIFSRHIPASIADNH